MKLAVFGCAHGELNNIYQEVAKYEQQNNITIDLVIICGDCQTMRHKDDMKCASIPIKYQRVGDFPEYYSGKKKIPKLTMFVGGNHEASNYLMTLPYGGWVCENFYYLGNANVIRYKGLRIAGLSGIYNYYSSRKARSESMPLDENLVRLAYHVRQTDVFKLQLLSKRIDEDPIDLFLSHDWPAKIYEHGNKNLLLRWKPFFKKDMQNPSGLGNPLTQPLVYQLKPKHWLAAHLHVHFEVNVKHDEARSTKFLSLSKIINGNQGKPGRSYMKVLEINTSKDNTSPIEVDDEIYYDPEWIVILRKTLELESNSNQYVYCPNIEKEEGKKYIASDDEINDCKNLLKNLPTGAKVPRNFVMSEPVIYDRVDKSADSIDPERQVFFPNPQTEYFVKYMNLARIRESKKRPAEDDEDDAWFADIDMKKK